MTKIHFKIILKLNLFNIFILVFSIFSKYEKLFQDLSMFSSIYLPTEQHKIERFKDSFRQQL
jgi:hypothetical protein